MARPVERRLLARARALAPKAAVWTASVAPLAYMIWALLNNQVGRDPGGELEKATGVWAIRFLCVTLAITPVRRVTGWHEIVRFRRMLGLFAFFYAAIHGLTYLAFDRFSWLDFPDGLSWSATAAFMRATGADVLMRPFLVIGLAAFLVMVPLAATSTPAMIRRLGGRRWQRLHRLVYGVALAALVHHWWPLATRFHLDLYGVVITVSIAFRVYWARRRVPGAARVALSMGRS